MTKYGSIKCDVKSLHKIMFNHFIYIIYRIQLIYPLLLLGQRIKFAEMELPLFYTGIFNYVSIYTYMFWFTGKQNKFLKSLVTSHSYATSTSFVAADSIGNKGKPLKDGESLKNAFINCLKNLFNDFANKKKIFERIN